MVGVFWNKISRDELKPGDHIYSWRRAYLFAHHGIYVGDGKVIHFTRAAGQKMGTETVLDRYIFSSCPSHPLDTLLAWARKRAGIYVGDGKVINYTRVAGQEMGTQTVLAHYISSSCPAHPSDTPCPQCGDQSSLDGVLSSCIECFLSGGNLYIFRYAVSPALFLAQARGGTCTLAASDPPEDVLHRADFLLQNGFGVYHISKNNCEDFAIYCKTGLLVIPSVSVGQSGQAASFRAAAGSIVSSPLRFLTTTTSFSCLAFVGCGMYCVSRLINDIGVRGDVTKVPVESLVTR